MATKEERQAIKEDPIRLAIYRRALHIYWKNRHALRARKARSQPPKGHDHPEWV